MSYKRTIGYLGMTEAMILLAASEGEQTALNKLEAMRDSLEDLGECGDFFEKGIASLLHKKVCDTIGLIVLKAHAVGEGKDELSKVIKLTRDLQLDSCSPDEYPSRIEYVRRTIHQELGKERKPKQ